MISNINTCILSVFILTALLVTAGCSSPQGNADNGKRWYMMHNCSGCHGANGDDGRAPKIKKLDRSFGSFVRKLRTTDTSIMPAYPDSKLSKEDAADIYAFLQSK